MVLSDLQDSAGTARGHYFHQDLLVAQFVEHHRPKRHIDVGSRIDGFVAHVASFRKIEVIDIRPMDNFGHPNISFIQGDLMRPNTIGKADSISCLHAIEHFGLGRYGDQIDPDGHIKGVTHLVDALEESGLLYISFPIGLRDEVHFNAHRVFHPKTILAFDCVRMNLTLIRFDCVDDGGNLHRNVEIDSILGKFRYGCGIYTFRRNY